MDRPLVPRSTAPNPPNTINGPSTHPMIGMKKKTAAPMKRQKTAVNNFAPTEAPADTCFVVTRESTRGEGGSADMIQLIPGEESIIAASWPPLSTS